MYLFRARDRRLMEQTARDIALTLQRDYFSFSLKKTTELSTKVQIYTGYLSTGANAYPNISWTAGSQVDAAFSALEQLLLQLSLGSYQSTAKDQGNNPSIWPVQSINWKWIQSLYAFINPTYQTWLTTNNFVVPLWADRPM